MQPGLSAQNTDPYTPYLTETKGIAHFYDKGTCITSQKLIQVQGFSCCFVHEHVHVLLCMCRLKFTPSNVGEMWTELQQKRTEIAE